MTEQKCSKCEKIFEQNESNGITCLAMAVGRDPEKQLCYSCALDKVTGNSAPEEADFNSARLISGEMTDETWELLHEDMRAREEGRSSREPYGGCDICEQSVCECDGLNWHRCELCDQYDEDCECGETE